MKLTAAEIRSGHETGGFSRIDLAVIILTLVAILGAGMIFVRLFKVRAEQSQCLGNLKKMGVAMALYTRENQDRIPFAGLRPKLGVHYSWDDLINRQLGGSFSENQLRDVFPTNDVPVLRCPCDRVQVSAKFNKPMAHRRSYAMPAHDMLDANWPPGTENRTGIGLVFDVGPNSTMPASIDKYEIPETKQQKKAREEAKKKAKETELPSPFPEPKPRQASFTTSMIPNPAKTILLTERVSPKNIIGNIEACTVKNPYSQIDGGIFANSALHKGKFSYLMLDGHVEPLKPVDTLGKSAPELTVQSGMWTVGGNDR